MRRSPIACRECGKAVCPLNPGNKPKRGVLCLECLARHPDAPFGERLRSFRLAAGLTTHELAERVGVPWYLISKMELLPNRQLRWEHLRGLMRVLGAGLVTLGLEQSPGPGDEAGEPGPA